MNAYLAAIILLTLCSTFFSATETAFSSANRIKLKNMAANDNKRAAQALALTEDFEDLSKHTSLLKCGIPYIKDIPDDIELVYNETYRPSGPYGAAGCGEAPLDAPHPAILNAIFNATGARVTRIPATPDKVLAALKAL